MKMSFSRQLLLAILGLIFVQLTLTSSVKAARRTKPPLIGEEPSGKNRRSADCHFGKQVYELQETWHPDLGPPFGVMYCIRCECIAVQKKRRIAGRTLCKNIKNECPKPTCDEPVLLPGRCCKVCPEDPVGPLKEDVSSIKDYEDDDKQAKDFAAILTKKSSEQQQQQQLSLATARFSFQKRHLYYSLVMPSWTATTTESTWRPARFLQFLSEDGNILEEQELAPNDYYNATGKICGVWRKVPRIYKQLLREEKLWVALSEDKESEALTGRISRYKALSTELLSSLLIPTSPCPGCGGTAAVSIASSSNSIHLTIAVSGLIPKGADSDSLVVRLETSETSPSKHHVIEQLSTISKPQEVNVVEIRTVLESQEMRLLLRGHVMLTVYSSRNPDLRLRGTIGPRISCDIFDSLLTSSEAVDEPTKSVHPATGLAWLYIGKTGNIHYHIQVQGLKSAIINVTLETAPDKNKKRRVIEDVTPSLSGQWMNGTLNRLSAKDVELLYEGGCYITITSEEVELRGRIELHIAGESHLALDSGPILLKAVNGTRAGLGWVSVDHQCAFHYDVAVNGFKANVRRDQHSLTVLELVDVPKLTFHGPGTAGPSGIALMDEQSSYGNDNLIYMPNIRLLDEFSGNQIENSVGDLTKLSLARMSAGVAYLKLTEARVSDNPGTEFQGWLTNIRVPGSCLRNTIHADSEGVNGEQSLGPGYVFDRRDDNEIPQTSRCFYEGKLYDDGSQWTAEHDRCMMCSCQRGRVVCDSVVCPALTCGTTVHQPGDCCPMCENVTLKAELSIKEVDPTSQRGCHFDGDKKFHPAGSSWHPYLPPFGFSKCATCVCDPRTLKVNCTKLTCPPLSCSESEAFRPEPMACCKQCATPPPITISTPAVPVNKDNIPLGEEAQAYGEAEILAAGGCHFKGDVFENGEEWHPRIQPWGEMRCINCNCKDGKVKCKKKKCSKTRCSSGKSSSSSSSSGSNTGEDCCPPCPEDGSATSSPPTSAKENSRESADKKKRPRNGRSRSSVQRRNSN